MEEFNGEVANRKPDIKPRDLLAQVLSRNDKEAIRRLVDSVEEMLKIWKSCGLPSSLNRNRLN